MITFPRNQLLMCLMGSCFLATGDSKFPWRSVAYTHPVWRVSDIKENLENMHVIQLYINQTCLSLIHQESIYFAHFFNVHHRILVKCNGEKKQTNN